MAHRAYVTVPELSRYGMKVATEYTQLNGCGSVPLKLYLQKQAAGHIWSTGHNLSTPDLMLEIDIEEIHHKYPMTIVNRLPSML